MISSITIQTEYQKLYAQVRRYLWPFDIVELLAELEVACYQAFPSILDIRGKFAKLQKELADTAKEDEELQKSLTDFEEVINSDDTTYLTLNKVREVISE